MKRFLNILLTCTLVFCCTVFQVGAIEYPEDSLVISRASGRLNHSIPSKTTLYLGDDFYLDKDEIISYNCTYSPKSASLDFGLLDSNNVFHYLNCTSGSFSKSIKVDTPGQYTLAIRNNESYAVTVTGTVKY